MAKTTEIGQQGGNWPKIAKFGQNWPNLAKTGQIWPDGLSDRRARRSKSRGS